MSSQTKIFMYSNIKHLSFLINILIKRKPSFKVGIDTSYYLHCFVSFLFLLRRVS